MFQGDSFEGHTEERLLYLYRGRKGKPFLIITLTHDLLIYPANLYDRTNCVVLGSQMAAFIELLPCVRSFVARRGVGVLPLSLWNLQSESSSTWHRRWKAVLWEFPVRTRTEYMYLLSESYRVLIA